MASVRRLCRGIIRLAAGVVPARWRDSWRTEWLGELEYGWASRRPPLGAAESLRRAAAAVAHALFLRKESLHMETLVQDVRFALRLLARQPGFTAVAVLTLALGVGANTAIFSIVNRTLLAPLPFGDPDRLVQVWETLRLPTEYYAQNTPAPGTFEIWNAHGESADGLAAYSVATLTLTGGGDPEQLTAIRASVNLMDVLKIAPAMGRNFQPSDDVVGAPGVVILTHRLWMRRFNQDPAVVGRTISINGAPALVAGVLPPEVPLSLRPVDLWVPIRLQASEGKWNRMLWVVARLKPGVTPESFQRQLDAGMHADGPDKMDAEVGVNVQPMDAEVRGGVRPDLIMVFSVTLAVLLIACTNIATMLMARSIVRRRELSVRAALGAGRGRLVRMLLVESLMLGLAGAAAGVVIGASSLGAIRAAMPDALALQISGTIDGRVLAFSTVVALATALVFGLAPVAGLSTRTLTVTSRTGDGQERRGLRWLRSSLVVVEMALAVVLLAGAALLVKTFAAIVTTPTGFSSEHVLTAQV
ncbi:MAG TPA: ABC transporter permease, partial [Vicinamibacterales bacterium]|nr:ABC transporter permease [Vicinamibacterales bacterium]